MANYDVNNWYWNVGGITGVVYSSAAVAYVPLSNSAYTAWVSAGGRTTTILNGAELYEVLSNQWVPNYLSNGVALQSTGTPSVNSTYPLDPQTQFNLTGVATGIASGRGLPGGGSTFLFNNISFTASQFLSVASALESYVYNFNIALATLVISGSGSLPTVRIVIA